MTSKKNPLTSLMIVSIVTIIVLMFISFYFFKFMNSSKNESNDSPQSQAITPTLPQTKVNNYFVFVPYWNQNSSNVVAIEGITEEVTPIYFGLSSHLGELSKNDPGFLGLDQYLKTNSKKGWLTFRLIDKTESETLLNDTEKIDKLFDSFIQQAKNMGFEGVLLDFETDLEQNAVNLEKINQMFRIFVEKSKAQNMKNGVVVFGDSILRNRPYDLKYIGENFDIVMVMVYDFHKPNDLPGPNFPLKGKNKYGYDLISQIADFSKVIDKNKLIYIFGMYGYDWLVTIEKKPLKKATSMSLIEIREKYLSNCPINNCVVSRDPLSREQEISFVDKNLQYHLIWFEDEVSVKEKIMFLESMKVNNFAFWAKGYF